MNRRHDKKILIELVGRFPEGASLEELMIGLDPVIPRRTLQRWLSALVKSGDLIPIGAGRGRRYTLLETVRVTDQIPTALIPISSEGVKINSLVSQPIQARRPVSYHRKFLESYSPNHTYYLSEKLRKKLLILGGSTDEMYPAGTYARQIFQRLLIDLSWNSSRLEGNTYSLLETERLLDLGKAPIGKDLRETQMILNHKAAIEFLIYSADQIGVNRFTILNLHTLLSDNLMSDPAASGKLRSIPVGIAKSVYQPSAIPQVIDECFNLMLDKAKVIEDPFEQAFFLMVQIPYLQPFDDVNKRTSRLSANIPLIQGNLSPLSFIDVPEQTYVNGLLGVYELNRVELLKDVFEWAYERSCALYAATRKSIGEPDLFRIKYRTQMQLLVGDVVRQKMSKDQAVELIRNKSMEIIPKEERSRFIELIERELQSLHEGNIARYQLRLDEYEKWKVFWI